MYPDWFCQDTFLFGKYTKIGDSHLDNGFYGLYLWCKNKLGNNIQESEIMAYGTIISLFCSFYREEEIINYRIDLLSGRAFNLCVNIFISV
jgi:hypothetical protein